VKLRVLIAEDEPPARRHLRELLETEPDIEIVAEVADGLRAVQEIIRLQPDLVLLDIGMPELDGLAVVERVGAERMPHLIFVTAYDEHAVRAFEICALDYVLKPYEAERLRRAIARAREQIRARTPSAVDPGMLANALRPGSSARIAIRHNGRIRMLPFDGIDYIEAEGAHVRIHCRTDSYLVRDTLSALESQLDSGRFARVHRSLIVNVERVGELEALYRGEYVIWLQDGTRLVSGRTYRATVQRAFGLRD
jgi:two-component system LytT family response regulator